MTYNLQLTYPCSVLRGMQKPSGLFDRDDVALLCPSSSDCLDIESPQELLTSVLEGKLYDQVTSADDSWTIEDSFCNLEDGFGMDIFTDLSQFLTENATVETTSGTSLLESKSQSLDQSIRADVSVTTTTKTEAKRSLSSSDLDHSYLPKRCRSDCEQAGKEQQWQEKYAERRMKNNVASKRSRETRKQKFAMMDETAATLAKQNEMLRGKIAEMEKLASSMKQTLVQHMAKR